MGLVARRRSLGVVARWVLAGALGPTALCLVVVVVGIFFVSPDTTVPTLVCLRRYVMIRRRVDATADGIIRSTR
jgi:hypothetical protein